MKLHNKTIKQYLMNVYFINGTAYAGKSTMCKLLAEKYNMYHCEENYSVGDFIDMSSVETHPNMNYHRTKTSWEEFVSRDKETYNDWIVNTSEEMAEFEILELISLSKDQKVIVDTNIPHHILKEIADYNQVVYMVTTPEISTNEFFNRLDSDKNFIKGIIDNMKNSEEVMTQYKETIRYINRQEVVDAFVNSGFYTIKRETVEEDIMTKMELIEKHFDLIDRTILKGKKVEG